MKGDALFPETPQTQASGAPSSRPARARKETLRGQSGERCIPCLLLVVNMLNCMFDSAIAIPFEVPTQELLFLRLTAEPYYLKQRITVDLFGETDASSQSRV